METTPSPQASASSADPLVSRLAQLKVAVVADCLDKLDYRNQVLRSDIRPIAPTHRMAGRAHTVTTVEVDHVPENRADWYKGEIAAVDSLKPGDVLVASRADGSFWGELLSTAAQFRGSVGVVADAYTRDVTEIVELGFPGFFRGIYSADSLGRIDVAASGEPIVCGDVEISEGDLILADFDGVVAVPARIAEQAIADSEVKQARETDVRSMLSAGQSVREVFDAFGIL